MEKKKLGILASCLLVFSLTACSQGNSTNSTNWNQAPSTTTGDTSSSSSGGKKTIVYSVKDLNGTVEEEIQKYEALHPNIEIKIETMDQEAYDRLDPKDSDGRAAMMDKFRTTRDLEMLAGKGPDIMEFNGVPQKYISHHLLVDVSEMMEQDATFKKDDYFSNILEGSRDSEGKFYGMPLGFSLVGLYGNEKEISKYGMKIDDNTWTWKDFLNIAQQLATVTGFKSAIYGYPTEALYGTINANPSLVLDSATNTAHFDSPEFRDLMNQAKLMKDEGMMASNVNESYFMHEVWIPGPWEYFQYADDYYQNAKFYTEPHPEGKQGGYYQLGPELSINANSKVKEEAWDFVKFMMSDEANNPTRSFGIPINKQGFAKQINQLKSEGMITTQLGEKIKFDAGTLDEFERRVNGASLQRSADSFLAFMISNELDAFMSGQKSLDAVIKILQDKATTYLNE